MKNGTVYWVGGDRGILLIEREEGNKKMLTWKCHICGEERPDHLIEVYSTDLSEQKGFPVGTIKQNVRYCADKKTCGEQVVNFNFLKEV